MKNYLLLFMAVMAFVVSGCSSSKDVNKITQQASTTRTTSGVATTTTANTGNRSEALPKAVIYKMNGDYSQYVPITISRSGKQVISYPAPTDLTANSTPLDLGDGWWLDRRGAIGDNTAFLDYTYDQYRALKQAPTASELLNHVMSAAKVSKYQVLPITLNEALANPSSLQQYIK